MSSGSAVSPSSSTQLTSFNVALSTIPQQSTSIQQQQQQQQQLHDTLNNLFPSINSNNRNPFNIPLNMIAAATNSIIPHYSIIPSSQNFQQQQQQHNRIKIKRCRQRVDAGEPRNSYQSQIKTNVVKRESININENTSLCDIKTNNSNIFDEQCLMQNQNFLTPQFFDTLNNLSQTINSSSVEKLNSDEIENNNENNIEECLLNNTINCLNSPSITSSSLSSTASSSARRKSFQPKRQKNHQNLEINEEFNYLSTSVLANNFENTNLSEKKRDEIVNIEPSDKNNTVNISVNNNDNNVCNVIDNNNEENDNDYCSLKIVINKKQNKVKTETINNNNEKNDENFIEEKTKKLDSYFMKAKNIKTESILDENDISYENYNIVNNKDIVDENAINYKNEERSEDLNTTLDNLSCCSENFLTTANNNDEKNSSINISDNDNNNEENNDNIKNNCNANETKATIALSPLLSAIFSNTNKNCNVNANANNNNNISKIQQMFEAQNKFYSTLILEQQRKSMSAITSAKTFPLLNTNNEKHELIENTLIPQAQLHQSKNLAKNEIKSELFSAVTGLTIDKTQNKKTVQDSFTNFFRFFEAAAQQQQHQRQQLYQQQQAVAARALMTNALSGSNLTTSASYNTLFSTNPALAVIAAAAAARENSVTPNLSELNSFPENRNSTGNGIFPSTSQLTSFKGLSRNSIFFQSQGVKSPNDDGPKRKRAKVTDTVRGPRSLAMRNECSTSLPVSERSSPQISGNFFLPTMVSHSSFYSNNNKTSTTGLDGNRDISPANVSEEFNNENNNGKNSSFDGIYQQKYTLTHVHLRKAKLMFFYTRYPSSAVLKTYFPDIHFNKNNTAQLVKWFSNFREFYYMQMEKYAKQAIAEGIRNKEEIIVTTESEIYKQLNQHYNRNNIIQPPPHLQFVIQETLKEFFLALLAGKDSEPSWKKVIYKVIQQLDDQIPEYFKDPNFIESFEQV